MPSACMSSLHPAGVELSSDDDVAASSDSNDDFSPMLLPPGFQPASTPPHGKRLVPFEKAGQQMIGQHILFKWPTHGWCLGKISALNTNLKTLFFFYSFFYTFFPILF